MLGLDPELYAFASGVSAAQLCGETPGEPYLWLQDSGCRCTQTADHVLVGMDHVSPNGMVW